MTIGNDSNLEGVLLVDKPMGITSHDIVDRLRRKLKMKKIGHAGTLDPLATGLMIMLVGKATKVSQYLISLDKAYEGDFLLGIETDSQDADGDGLPLRLGPAAHLVKCDEESREPPSAAPRKTRRQTRRIAVPSHHAVRDREPYSCMGARTL